MVKAKQPVSEKRDAFSYNFEGLFFPATHYLGLYVKGILICTEARQQPAGLLR